MFNHAIITGGSSGIGLAFAKQLAAAGYQISIIARDESKLAVARIQIEKVATSGAQVQTFSADVGDEQICKQAVKLAVQNFGPVTWAISCAGIVHAGRFIDQTVQNHRDQVNTNYFGSVNFVAAVVSEMPVEAQPRLILVGSGAGFAGLYGYGSYGPSKFAVRGLAETLRVELAELGISVSLLCPADTQTPQLQDELKHRHKVTSYLAKSGKTYSADEVAAKSIRLANKNRFLITFGWQLHVLGFCHSVIGAWFRNYQIQIVRKLSEKK